MQHDGRLWASPPTSMEKQVIALERPLFGQFAQQLVSIRTGELSECLAEQSHQGGRLGQIFRRRNLVTEEELRRIFRLQARWVARTRQGDLDPGALPFPVFLSLCMPAYNEQSNIADTLDAARAILAEFVERFEIVVVDDGSRDGTGDTVAAIGEKDPRIRLVRHPENRGYGAAVSSGLRAAKGDVIGFTDSDGQFSLLDTPQLLMRLEENDLVIGYRYNRADPWWRRLNAWGWNSLVNVTLGIRVRDLDCAFKLFRREVVEHLRFTTSGACINAEIMVQCTRRGLNMGETPVTHYPRYHGEPTGANLHVITRAFRELPKLWKYRRVSVVQEGVTGRQQRLQSEPLVTATAESRVRHERLRHTGNGELSDDESRSRGV